MTGRHSTGVTEPAPAVEELLAAVGQAAIDACESLPYDMRLRPEPTQVMVGRHQLASEPMQRLRAAWTAEWQREADRRSVDEERALFRAERAERERDEARAGRAAWYEVTLELQAEVERLRAAVPDLPDVGPATRDDDDWVVDGERLYLHENEDPRRAAAQWLAVAVTRDREAEERAATVGDATAAVVARNAEALDALADTTSEGQAGPVPTATALLWPDGRVLYAASALHLKQHQEVIEFDPKLRHVGWYSFAEVQGWADAHRARTHGEDAQCATSTQASRGSTTETSSPASAPPK